MTFEIRTWQASFWALLGVFGVLVAAAVILGVSYASRVITARMEGGSRTLSGWSTGPVTASAALRRHRKAAIAALATVGLALLLMLCLLGDSRMSVINEDAADALTISGQVETIEPRSLADGLFPFAAEGGLTFGLWMTVDGAEYHALSDGGMAVGDTVTLQYLPRSRCVLYIGDGSTLPVPAVTAQEVSTVQAKASPPVTSMAFAYADYLRSFLVETVLCVVAGGLLIRTAIGAVVSLVRRRMSIGNALRTAFCAFVLVNLMMAGCSSVWNGCWRLMLEKPEQAVVVSGQLEAVEPLNSSGGTRFSTGWGTQFGCWFTVDGGRYFGMFEGDLTAGDEVTLRCLPRSRCILYISAKEEPNQ